MVPPDSPVRIGARPPVPPVPFAVRRAGADGEEPIPAGLPLGTLDGGVLASVDGAGMVQALGATWSLDWWIGAEDRWHHPSMEASVRQRPLEGSPVVQTSMKVPGGDIVQRVGGAQVRVGQRSVQAVVVEVENTSAVPVALALVVRPWALHGPGRVTEVRCDGPAVRVDGRPGLLLDREPARCAHDGGDGVARRLAAGDDEAVVPVLRGEADLEVAFVVPLTHGATVRVLVEPPEGAGGADPGSWSSPALSSVAAGWVHHRAEDPTVVVPPVGWSELVERSGSLVRLAGPGEVTRALGGEPPGPVPWGTRLGAVAEALGGLRADEANDAVATALAGALRRGWVRLGDGSDGGAALLFASAATLRSPVGSGRADDLLGPVTAVVRRLDRRGSEPGEHDLVAAALTRLAPGVATVGQPELAGELLDLAERLGARPIDAPHATLVGVELRAGIRAGRAGSLDDLAAELSAGTWEWDVAELAAARLAVLEAMATDDRRGPRLLPSWTREWDGAPIEARRVPTAWGRLSFALRWHDHRPAVLWDIEPEGGSTTAAVPSISAPGLDPDWTGSGWSGEALLRQGDRLDR